VGLYSEEILKRQMQCMVTENRSMLTSARLQDGD
jgi:hypothetical protein